MMHLTLVSTDTGLRSSLVGTYVYIYAELVKVTCVGVDFT